MSLLLGSFGVVPMLRLSLAAEGVIIQVFGSRII